MRLHLPRLTSWRLWHIPLASLAVIGAFFVAWELIELRFLSGVSSETRRWLYLGRGVFGAACVAFITIKLMRRHERRQVRLRQAIVQTDKLAAVGQMAAGLAHEVGNPLAAISSLVQLVERGTIPPAEAERLRLIQGEIDRINRIVRQLVDFARPASGEMKPLNVIEVLDDAIDLASYDPRAAKVRFERAYAAALPPIRAVREHLIQIFLNVFYNAMDAMPQGGVIAVTAIAANGVTLEIRDGGHGIPADRLEQVFRPFYTTKPRGHGTGLGLAVTRHLLTQNRGRITLESEPGKGTSVRIVLPADTVQESTGEDARLVARRNSPEAVRQYG